ncbi:hypothetical protein BGW80DRAFT_1309754 [Lactifluus volemus]|nr:hypothetical protein BGW80DRAFT_1309754 [Lactifluus volemus]
MKSNTKTTTPSSSAPLLKRPTLKIKLNPSAPIFTPSSPSPSTQQQQRRLDPTARAFTPRASGSAAGKDSNDSSAPSSPADSVGPVTPSPVRGSAFTTFDSARAYNVARRGRSSTSVGVGGKLSAIPVGVGKMRVVRPEEVVIGERRAGEVFVFF